MATVPSIRLTARGAARVRGGHPWVHRPEVPNAPPPGADAIAIADEQGRPLGSALWCPEPAPIALRVYSREETFVPFDDALISERVSTAILRRASLLPGIEARRLVHAEADGLPGLFVDAYKDAMVIQTSTAALDRRAARIAALLVNDHGARMVVRRDDGSIRDFEGLPRERMVLSGRGGTLTQYREGPSTFEVDLLSDKKTGAFLDQRDNHLRVGSLARGRVLDAFSYHGGFALAAAAYADEVVAIEENPQAVVRAAHNAELSGRTNVKFHEADAFAMLRQLEARGETFDLVVIDPPALTKRAAVPQAQRAYQELALRGMRLTAPGGFMCFCSCSGKITPELFEELLVRAARDAGRIVQVAERRGAGPDHPVLLGVPETEYLKCWILAAV